jgi:hypothetical protein
MLQLTSPRLPGVPLLHAQYTGAEYSRWRRSIKFALEAKGTWKYCNGQATMPMPTSPTVSTANLQPSLLEERREWVKHDREVKLDIFLSLAEEVMLELFEVGPPLPPSNMNAQEMLEALEERFAVFKFESYHHAFCHFLNLHIDQYPSIEEFNREFLTTLEDLLDHGNPLSNVQACSAYLSKLRCTQNPWVAKKLEEWDTQSREIDCMELLRESPPWSIIRPLATKTSQNFQVESIPEEYLEGSSGSDSNVSSEESDASTVSSMSSHSRNVSTNVVDTTPSLNVMEPQRQLSVWTTKSQEITVCASPEAIAELNSLAARKDIQGLPTPAIPERGSSKHQVPRTLLSDDPEAPLPEWLASKKSVARRPPPPHDRPLPPLPTQAQQTKDDSQSSPPKAEPTNFTNASTVSLTMSTRKTPPTPSSSFPALRLETTHPTLRPQTSNPLLDVHPALRTQPSISSETHPAITTQPSAPVLTLPLLPTIDTTPLSFPFPTTRPSSAELRRPSYASQRRQSASTPNLAIPWPSTPDIAPRPHSSRASLPFTQAPNPMPSQVLAQPNDDDGLEGDNEEEDEEEEEEDSDVDLPLQGTRDSAWTYLYESKGGYLITQQTRSPTTASPTSPPPNLTPFPKASLHKKSSSLDFVARLSGDSLLGLGLGSGPLEAETEKERKFRKKKSWINGANLARFTAGKGVKEMI